jgi:diguanylate cyclase (GGDEF)-like protein
MEIRRSVHERALGSSDDCVTADLQEDPWFRQKEDFALYPYRSYMARAWFYDGRPAGLMAVYRDKRTTWTEQETKKFAFLVDQSSLALQNARLRNALQEQATSDGLTGLANHLSFYERIEGEFARHERQNRVLAVLMIDLDFFKKINDTAGHKVGDQVLQQIAKLLKVNTRKGDILGRLGGDEFAVALPETSIEDACAIGERILLGARKMRVAQFTSFSLSIGCAAFPQDAVALAELLERGDQALYVSKSLGRGRLSRYSDVSASEAEAGTNAAKA